MILLVSTSDILRVITDATSDIEVHASYMDNNAGTITPGRTNTPSITTATTTTVVASPGAGVQRNVKHLSLTNNHASTSCNVAVEHFDGTNAVELRAVNLLAGENLTVDANGNWRHYDANGGEYPAVLPVATQADMEAGTSIVLTVTPGRQHFHPSAAKFWCKAGLTGNNLASYNVTSIGDTGVGLMTVTIATDFSSANWCGVLSIENLDASIDAAADGQISMLGLAGQAAGTYAAINKNEAGTAAADPTTWHVVGFGDQ